MTQVETEKKKNIWLKKKQYKNRYVEEKDCSMQPKATGRVKLEAMRTTCCLAIGSQGPTEKPTPISDSNFSYRKYRD